MNYYSEFDPKAASWLRELITMRLIPAGVVDERSITDVRAADLHGFTQCHFFAGIGGWSLALQRAGWPATTPIWTGSCPCQGYSDAGEGLGAEDPRDLWPVWFTLIRECQPSIVVGEQVAAAIRHGWLDRLRADMEGQDYAVGGIVLGAHSAGAPHRRQRLYWVSKSKDANWRGELETGGTWIGRGGFTGSGVDGAVDNSSNTRLDNAGEHERGPSPCTALSEQRSGIDGLAIPEHAERGAIDGPRQDGLDGQDAGRQEAHSEPGTRGEVCSMAIPNGRDGRCGEQRQQQGNGSGSTMADLQSGGLGTDGSAPGEPRHVDIGGVLGVTHGDAKQQGSQGHPGHGDRGYEPRRDDSEPGRSVTAASGSHFWSRYAIIPCRDGKARIVEPGVAPLVAGIPRGVVPGCDPGAPGYANATAEARVMRLKGYGNAICIETAVAFIEATL